MEITGGHLKWGLERGQPTMIGYISHVPLVPRTRSEIMPQLLAFRDAHPDQLIAIAANLHAEDRKALVRTGVAVFDDPTVATEAVAKLVRAGQAFARAPQAPAGPGAGGGSEAALRAVLDEAGIRMAAETAIAGPEQALSLLERHGEIVLKLRAPGLVHKTEIGGVRTGLSTAADVEAAFAALSVVAATRSPDFPGAAHCRGADGTRGRGAAGRAQRPAFRGAGRAWLGRHRLRAVRRSLLPQASLRAGAGRRAGRSDQGRADAGRLAGRTTGGSRRAGTGAGGPVGTRAPTSFLRDQSADRVREPVWSAWI